MELTAKQYKTAVNTVAEISQVLLDESNTTAWIVPFSEILGGILEEAIF